MGRLLAVIGLVAVFAGCRAQAAGNGAKDDPARSVAAAEADGPPLLLFTDIFDREVRPLNDPSVQALVLVFVMPDCPIANSYVPALARLADEFAGRGVRWLIVHVDPDVTAEAARRHADEFQIKLPVVIDRDHRWVKRAGATRSPEAAVFSRTGKLLYLGRIDDRYAEVGKQRQEATQHDLADALAAIVAGRPVAAPFTDAVGCYIPELTSGAK